ncbi:MAG: GGDEF domain-containing protein [Sphaerochaeta sp.]
MHNRAHVKGIGYWTANLALNTLGKMMVMIPVSQTSSLVVILGSLLTLVGSVLFLFGLAAFTETIISHRTYAIFTISSAVFISLTIVFTENQYYRSIVHGLVVIFISVQYLRIIWKKRNMDPFFSKPFGVLFFLYVFFTMVFVYRTIGDFIAISKGLYMIEFDSEALRHSNFLSLIALNGVNFTTLLLSNNKLLSDLAKDAVEKNARLKKLQVKSEHDGLTGVLNRSGLENILNALISTTKSHESFMVCLVDIDAFKAINDTYGHEMGDKALIQLSQVFSSIIRPKDYVGRWGGDEFLIILTDIGYAKTKSLPDRILEEVEDVDWESRFSLPGFKLTISLGYCCQQYSETKNDLLRRCDQNLYRAKRQGKNSAIGDCC